MPPDLAAELRSGGVQAQYWDWGKGGFAFFDGSTLPHYSTDIVACIAVRDEVERLGVQEVFMQRLIEIVLGKDALLRHETHRLSDVQLYRLMNALPVQQCEAFLRAKSPTR